VPNITIGINESSVTTTSGLLGIAGWTNQKVLINGTLVVNSNFLISGCSLKMGKNAVIRIDPNITFQSVLSKYFRCGSDFWKGFIAMGGTANFWFNQIEDASIAIDIKISKANLVVVGNRFNRNYIGVDASNIVVNAILVANKFESTSNLNGNFFNSSYAGIRFRNCPAAVIGLTVPNPAYRNTFINQSFGIKLNKSTVNIGLSGFYHNFHGVNADSSKVWIQGVNDGMRSNFSQQQHTDIKTTHSALDVFFCNLDSCGSSCISSEMNNSHEQIRIHDNNMILSSQWPFNSKGGVYLERSTLGQAENFSNIIKRNNILIQGFGGDNGISRSGITVFGYPSTHDKMLIDSNTIEVFNGGSNGQPSTFINVQVNSADNFIVSHNIIRSRNTFESGKSRWGVYLHGGATLIPASGNLFINNNITGVGGIDDGCCAVHLTDAGPWGICSNNTDRTYRGYHFSGKCDGSTFGLNTMGDHSKVPSSGGPGAYKSAGIILEKSANIGDQECQNNIWGMPDYPELYAYAAIFDGNPPPTQLSMNEFYVPDLNDPSQAPPDRKPIDNWFKLGTNCFQTPLECAGQKPPHFSEYDEWVRSNYPLPQEAPEVEEWQNTRYLIAKLMRYPSLTIGSALIFKNSYAQSSAALFARFDSLINSLPPVSMGSQIDLNNLEANIISKQAQINSLDASITDYTNVELELLSSRTILLGELASFSDQRNAILAQHGSLIPPLLDACQQFNNALPTNQVYEQNQKVLNALTIQHARGLELTQLDKEALHTIAQQCIQIAGLTKSAAASMLPPEEGVQYWRENPESYNCIEREGLDHEQSSVKFILSPNPGSEVIHIQFEKPLNGLLTISDLSGRTVQMLCIKEETKVLDLPVAHLENGIYIIALKDESGKLPFTTKFVVLR